MIKRGYLVKIESYGGDLDWYNTYIQDGLSFEDAKWLHHFFDAYYAFCQHENNNSTKFILRAIQSTVAKLGYMWSEFASSYADAMAHPDCDYVLDVANDVAYTVLGQACEHSGDWNTVSVMEVHFIPVDIQECSATLWHE